MLSQGNPVNPKEIKNIIFDLDGTLIDSAPSILDTFQKTLKHFSYKSKKSFNSELVGPPLEQTLREISGETDPEKLSFLVEFFKKSYDDEFYAFSKSYLGMTELLEALVLAGKHLHIATNKRLIPAQKITELFSWQKYFQTIYSIDKVTPAYLNKYHMLRSMVSELGLHAKDCIYVGDRLEDGEAAALNAIPFIYVNWGYGTFIPEVDHYQAVKDSSELKEILIGK
jgi:phosphoglycolate phosphatase